MAANLSLGGPILVVWFGSRFGLVQSASELMVWFGLVEVWFGLVKVWLVEDLAGLAHLLEAS